MPEKEKKTTQDSGGHKKHHKYLKNYHIKKSFVFISTSPEKKMKAKSQKN